MTKKYAVTIGDKTIGQPFGIRQNALGKLHTVATDVWKQGYIGSRFADERYGIDTTGDFELGIATLEVDDE